MCESNRKIFSISAENGGIKLNNFRKSFIDFYQNIRAAKDPFIKAKEYINDYNVLIEKSPEKRSEFIADAQKQNKSFGKYLQTLDGAPATIDGYNNSISKMARKSQMAAKAVKVLNFATSALLTTAAISLALQIPKIFDKLIVTAEEQKEKTEEAIKTYQDTTSELESLNSELSTTKQRIAEINAKDKISLTDKSELAKLKATNDELQLRINLLTKQKETQAIAANKEVYKSYGAEFNTPEEHKARTYTGKEWLFKQIELYKELEQLGTNRTKKQQEEYEKVQKYITDTGVRFSTLSGQIAVVDDKSQSFYNNMIDLADLVNKSLNPEEWKVAKFGEIFNSKDMGKAKEELSELARSGKLDSSIIESQYPRFNAQLKEVGISAEEAASEINSYNSALKDTVVEVSNLSTIYSSLKDKTSLLVSAYEELISGQSISTETAFALMDVYSDLIPYYDVESKTLRITKDILIEKFNIQKANEIEALNAAKKTTEARLEETKATLALYRAEALRGENPGAHAFISAKREISSLVQEISSIEGKVNIINNLSFDSFSKSSSKSMSKSSSAAKNEKTELEKLNEELQEYIRNKEHEIFLLSKQKDTEEQQLSIYRKLQEVIHKQASKYRSMGLKETSEEIQELQNLWWKYADNISDIYSTIGKNYIDHIKDIQQKQEDNINSEIDKLEDLKDYWDKYYQDKIDALEAEHKATEKENSLLKIQNDLIKAQQELTNASKERTVKQLQGTEWVWIADPDTISNLTDAVTKAQEEYDKEIAEREYEDAIKKLEDAQKAAVLQYTEQIEALKSHLDSLNKSYNMQIETLQSMLDKQEGLLDGNITNVIASLDKLNSALSEYGVSISQSDIENAVKNPSSVAGGGNGNIIAPGIFSPNGREYSSLTQEERDEISAVQQMWSNSNAWANSSDSKKKEMHEENKTIAKNLGFSYDNKTGKWRNKKGVAVYHEGSEGVGGVTFNPQQEVFAKLLKGEVVLSEDMVTNGIKMMGMLGSLSNLGSIVNNNNQQNSNVTNQRINVTSNSNNFGAILNEALQLSKI